MSGLAAPLADPYGANVVDDVIYVTGRNDHAAADLSDIVLRVCLVVDRPAHKG